MRQRRARVAEGFAAGGRIAFVLAWLLGARSAQAAAQELTVSAAVSLREALEEVAASFEAEHADVEVRLNLGASGDLQRQIEAGAPADVFVSAASQNVDLLERRGAVDPRTRADVACNRLAVVVPARAAGGVPRRLEELAHAERIAIGSPKTVPAGRYAKQVLEAVRLWEVLQPKLVFAENVRAVLQYVARGEVDAGFVYLTDAAVEPGVRTAFEVDPGLHEPIVYPAAVVAGAPRRELARQFVRALTAPGGRAVLERRGFDVPPCRAAG